MPFAVVMVIEVPVPISEGLSTSPAHPSDDCPHPQKHPIMFASSSRNWNLVDVRIYFDKSGSNIGAEVLSVSILKKGECGDVSFTSRVTYG